MLSMRDRIRDEAEAILERDGCLPPAPKAEDLWDACDGDGYLALALALDYQAVRRELTRRRLTSAAA